MSESLIDDMDRQLIDMLSRDARISNRKIALDLDVTEGTVRGRIKRLQSDGLLSFTAITSVDLGTANKLAFIGVQADMGNLRDIADTITAIPAVTSVLVSRVAGSRPISSHRCRTTCSLRGSSSNPAITLR